MQTLSKPQLIKIHTLLNKTGLIEQKKNLVMQFSNNQTDSTKELSIYEAKLLIQALSKHDPLDAMRRKVFALAYDAGFIWGETIEDKKMNTIKLNSFLLHSGTVKKELGRMNKEELIKTVNQFSSIVNNKNFSNAKKQTDTLLKELNIETQINGVHKIN
jgi:hypothetical protein